MKNNNIRHSLITASLGGVAGMSDAFLYVYLPAEAEHLGFGAFIVGVLLSMNRFVRFFTNRWVAFFAQKIGVKTLFLTGLLIALLVNVLYALHANEVVWIGARILWGIAFSALRFSNVEYAGTNEKMATALGWGRSIHELILIGAYSIGPVIMVYWSGSGVFISYGILLFLSIPFAFWYLPSLKTEKQSLHPLRYELPGSIDVWVFLVAFSIDGLLIVGLTKLIVVADETNLLATAALFVSIRKVLNIVVSPISGRVIDRLPLRKSFLISTIFILSGLFLMAIDQVYIGLLCAFIGSSMNATVIPVWVVNTVNEHNRFNALTKISTSRDMGSAIGALTGLMLLSAIHSFALFISFSLILLMSSVFVLSNRGVVRKV